MDPPAPRSRRYGTLFDGPEEAAQRAPLRNMLDELGSSAAAPPPGAMSAGSEAPPTRTLFSALSERRNQGSGLSSDDAAVEESRAWIDVETPAMPPARSPRLTRSRSFLDELREREESSWLTELQTEFPSIRRVPVPTVASVEDEDAPPVRSPGPRVRTALNADEAEDDVPIAAAAATALAHLTGEEEEPPKPKKSRATRHREKEERARRREQRALEKEARLRERKKKHRTRESSELREAPRVVDLVDEPVALPATRDIAAEEPDWYEPTPTYFDGTTLNEMSPVPHGAPVDSTDAITEPPAPSLSPPQREQAKAYVPAPEPTLDDVDLGRGSTPQPKVLSVDPAAARASMPLSVSPFSALSARETAARPSSPTPSAASSVVPRGRTRVLERNRMHVFNYNVSRLAVNMYILYWSMFASLRKLWRWERPWLTACVATFYAVVWWRGDLLAVFFLLAFAYVATFRLLHVPPSDVLVVDERTGAPDMSLMRPADVGSALMLASSGAVLQRVGDHVLVVTHGLADMHERFKNLMMWRSPYMTMRYLGWLFLFFLLSFHITTWMIVRLPGALLGVAVFIVAPMIEHGYWSTLLELMSEVTGRAPPDSSVPYATTRAALDSVLAGVPTDEEYAQQRFVYTQWEAARELRRRGAYAELPEARIIEEAEHRPRHARRTHRPRRTQRWADASEHSREERDMASPADPPATSLPSVAASPMAPALDDAEWRHSRGHSGVLRDNESVASDYEEPSVVSRTSGYGLLPAVSAGAGALAAGVSASVEAMAARVQAVKSPATARVQPTESEAPPPQRLASTADGTPLTPNASGVVNAGTPRERPQDGPAPALASPLAMQLPPIPVAPLRVPQTGALLDAKDVSQSPGAGAAPPLAQLTPAAVPQRAPTAVLQSTPALRRRVSHSSLGEEPMTPGVTTETARAAEHTDSPRRPMSMYWAESTSGRAGIYQGVHRKRLGHLLVLPTRIVFQLTYATTKPADPVVGLSAAEAIALTRVVDGRVFHPTIAPSHIAEHVQSEMQGGPPAHFEAPHAGSASPMAALFDVPLSRVTGLKKLRKSSPVLDGCPEGLEIVLEPSERTLGLPALMQRDDAFRRIMSLDPQKWAAETT